ncbi:MAG: hypothetical protein EOM20_21660 [Spartobacteria bacterium]|nr:hypothetical protein [Spartobacteria bacterium]
MTFNDNGYLDAGIYDMEIDEMEGSFVDAFPASNTRSGVFSGYRRHHADLISVGLEVEEMIDGSFISTKNDPGDIDFVCFVNAHELDRLPQEKKELFHNLVSGKKTRDAYLCDAYFCPIVPEDDPLFPKLRAQRKYWMGEFGYDRLDRPKGIVRVQVAIPESDNQGEGGDD